MRASSNELDGERSYLVCCTRYLFLCNAEIILLINIETPLPSLAFAAVRPEEEMITLGLSRSGSSGENNGTAAVSNSKSSTFPATPGGVGRSQHVGQPQQAQQQRSGGGQHKPIRRTPGPPMSGMQNVGRQARHRRTPGAHSHDVS